LWLGVTHKITSEHKKVMACSAGVPAQKHSSCSSYDLASCDISETI